MIYTAFLLDAYASLTGQPVQHLDDVRAARGALAVHGHIQNLGDTRPVLGGWLGSVRGSSAIEGFGLEPGPALDPTEIVYQAVLADGSLSGRRPGFEFCGTRGENQSLFGLRVTLEGTAAGLYELSYLAAFDDGSIEGPAPAGAVCRSRRGAAMIGLRVMIHSRGRTRQAA